jgi:mono/diheme cytochrome c family protein
MIRPALSLLVVALLGCASTPTPAPTTTPPPAEAPVAAAPAPTTPTEAPVASTETPAATPEPAAPAATPEPAATPAAPAGPDVALGRAAFQRVCMSCHEEGDREGPHPGLNWPEARIRTLIRNGNRRMRPVTTARLSDADLEHLIAHLRATRVIR